MSRALREARTVETRPPDRNPRTAPVGACPLCGSPASAELFELPDRLFRVPGTYRYRKCSSCATVFQDPRVLKEDLPLCYPPDYSAHALPTAAPPVRSFSTLRERFRRAVVAAVLGNEVRGAVGRIGQRLARIPAVRNRAFSFGSLPELTIRPFGGRRALDVGCGSGVVLLDLTERGWEAEGVEWDEATAQQARRVSGCPVFTGSFEEVELPTLHYDLIVMHHVLEHLSDPPHALRRIADLLAPAGRAVLVYPNPASLAAHKFHDHWFSWDAPRHVVLPSPAGVGTVAQQLNLHPVRIRTSARSASVIAANSRAYSAGRAANSRSPGIQDRLFGVVERALVRMGKDVGEELVLVFEKGG